MRKKNNWLAIITAVFFLIANTANVSALSTTTTTTTTTQLSAPTMSYYPTAPTNKDVTVTVYYPSIAKVKQYKLGLNGVWTTYSGPVILTSNVYFLARYQDSLGVWSPLGGVTVSNIDKTPPVNPIFTSSIMETTNQDVTVTIGYSPDSTTKQYKIGSNGVWENYTASVILSSNNTIYAKASDSVGNWTSITNCSVFNIDKTSPISPTFSASTNQLTNQDVTITVNYSDDSTIKQVKIGEAGLWTDYTSPIAVSTHSAIYARACDNAGNWTADTNYLVENIDKTPPIAPAFTSSITEATNQNVLITIGYSSDSTTKQYRIGSDGVWESYIAPVMLNSNNTIYARASDSVGNWTADASYLVENIDKVPPTDPSITASTSEKTCQPVTITLNYSQDSVLKQYKLGLDGNWTDYTAPFMVSTNAAIYAKSSDVAGNSTLEVIYQITNIVPPKMVLGYTVKNYSTDVSSYNSIVANTGVLNEIATATYSVDGYGTLTGTAPTDQINYANGKGIITKLMVGNNFDANIAKQLLESPSNRQNLKNNILSILRTYNYKGVDIDLENIPASQRSNFTTFMSEIYTSLKPLGYDVSVAVVPKNYDSSSAPWTYAFDYQSLAMYSDYLMIMAYDEHYPGGTPGAVASIDWVSSIINYALTVVPKEKIVLGLAAYGYDWSTAPTRAYSINGCYNIASQYGATINFDNVTKSKYFSYTANGVDHTVWFDDADTIAYKLDIANSMDLKGIGIWRLGLENSNYWNMIDIYN